MDIGRINGRPFINNVSLGVYAQMLGDPDYKHHKLRVAYAKLRDAVLDTKRKRALRVAAPGETPLEDVIVVIVSNNPYEFSPLSAIGQHYRLDTGMLQATVLSAGTFRELDRMLAGVVLGTIEHHPGLRHWTDERLEVGVPGERIRAGIDGEPITLEAPLRFSVQPGALRILCRLVRPPTGTCHLYGSDGTPPAGCAAGCVRPRRAQAYGPSTSSNKGGTVVRHDDFSGHQSRYPVISVNLARPSTGKR